MNDSTQHLSQVQFQVMDVLMLSIVVLFLGMYLTRRIRFLEINNIPPAVTGGLIISALVALLEIFAEVKVSFNLEVRVFLLLAFFSTIGLAAKLRQLVAGGKALAILIVVAFVFLLLQDTAGVLLVKLLGAHPAYGLLGGSVSLAGGHGTAIAWGDVAEQAGLRGAQELGIAFATIGLICGGLIGGPIAGRLITRNKLQPVIEDVAAADSGTALDPWSASVKLPHLLLTLLLLALCIEVGSPVNRLLFAREVHLPGFLTALFVGVIITNLADVLKLKLNQASIDRVGDLSLNLFLAMSLMSMQLMTLANAAGPILFVVMGQMLVITLFVIFVVFRFMGRDDDAAVIAAGFAGMGMGATPVAIANMSAITGRYGPSAKAFLVVPLIGAFFIDIMNAIVIKLFTRLFRTKRPERCHACK